MSLNLAAPPGTWKKKSQKELLDLFFSAATRPGVLLMENGTSGCPETPGASASPGRLPAIRCIKKGVFFLWRLTWFCDKVSPKIKGFGGVLCFSLGARMCLQWIHLCVPFSDFRDESIGSVTVASSECKQLGNTKPQVPWNCQTLATRWVLRKRAAIEWQAWGEAVIPQGIVGCTPGPTYPYGKSLSPI